MTATNPLSYANPRSMDPDAGAKGYTALAAALAAAVGFLGANAFADAAGFPSPRENYNDQGYVALRVLCGIVVFVVAFVVLTFLLRELRALAHLLGRTTSRPSPAIAMAGLICGTACAIAAVLVQLESLRNPSGFTVNAAGPSAGAHLSVQTPLMVHIVSVMVFLLGVALIAVGIWSSMDRPAGAGPHATAA